ncbi:MAG: hypothetical protein IJR13_05015 [Bacteroidales bacterium]|nr:hypothetical protein [Bacteroidales bacterium]
MKKQTPHLYPVMTIFCTTLPLTFNRYTPSDATRIITVPSLKRPYPISRPTTSYKATTPK